MTKAIKPKARQNQIKTEAPSPKQDEFAEALAALRHATTVLTGAANQLQQLARSAAAGGGAAPAAAAAPEINTWDDPFSEAVPSLNPPLKAPIAVAVTVNANPLLRTAIVEPELPAARYALNTEGFRYWVAAEALARGINFWDALLPAGTTWSTSNPMRVILVDVGPQLNARYVRNDGLHFFQRTVEILTSAPAKVLTWCATSWDTQYLMPCAPNSSIRLMPRSAPSTKRSET